MSEVEFGELFTFIRNGMNVKQDKSGNGLPITRIETISDATIDGARVGYAGLIEGRCSNWLMETGDLLFSHINSVEHVGKCAVYRGVPEKLVHGMNLLCLRCDPSKLLPEFAKYLIRGTQFRTRLAGFINKAVNQASVSIGNLKTIPVSVPSLAAQRRIAEVLDRVETLRAKRRAAFAQFDSLNEAVFLDLFGDPATNPKGWIIRPLDELSKRITKGESPGWQGFSYQDRGALFVTSENVRLGEIDLNVPKFVPLDFHKKLSRSALKDGDLLVNLVGASIGRSCVFPGWDGPANVNQAVGVITLDSSLIEVAFLAGLLTSQRGQEILLGNRVEAARANISLTDLREMKIPLPPLPLQRDFTRRIAAVDKLKAAHRASLTELDALFAALQHRAFRGEL